MLAFSAWTGVAAAATAVLVLVVLVMVALGLYRRLKDLNATFQGASGRTNEALGEMRVDLDRVSEGLDTLRRSREETPEDEPT